MGRAATRRKKAVPMCHDLTQAERAWVCASIAHAWRTQVVDDLCGGGSHQVKVRVPAHVEQQAFGKVFIPERTRWVEKYPLHTIRSPILDALDAMGPGQISHSHGGPSHKVLMLYMRQEREWAEDGRVDWKEARDTAYAMMVVLCPEAAEMLAAISKETTEEEIDDLYAGPAPSR